MEGGRIILYSENKMIFKTKKKFNNGEGKYIQDQIFQMSLKSSEAPFISVYLFASGVPTHPITH